MDVDKTALRCGVAVSQRHPCRPLCACSRLAQRGTLLLRGPCFPFAPVHATADGTDCTAMKRTTTWLAAAMFLLPLGAQGKPAPAEDAKTRLRNLQAEQKQIISDWQKKARDAAKAAEKAAEVAKKGGKPIPALPMRPDFTELRGKYLDAAKKYPGESAVPFLLQALGIGSTAEEREEVVDLLLDEHADSPRLHELAEALPYLDRMVSAAYAKRAFTKIEKHGKNVVLLGWLAFARSEGTLRSEPATSKAFQDAKAAAAVAIAQAEDKKLQAEFDALVAEQEKFGLGMVAPEISGADLDGVAFKLSDYKGKVVFLDFWGDW
ncbi:MAG TPA: hypothetical protein VF384_01490 [Planctomycetota bacterium]